MHRRDLLRCLTSAAATAVSGVGPGRAHALAAAARPDRFPLRIGPNRRHLVDASGRPFFVMGDTPWFVQKLKEDGVRLIMEDRLAKGYNALFLEILDDSRIPSVDGHGRAAFATDTDVTRPVEAYWKYADWVLEEAERRGFFVIMSDLWYGYGKGLWMHHVTPENARVYGAFLGKRYARFKNLMWMHAGDRNPDARLAECTRTLAREIRAAAPHHLHTVHNAPESASAAFHHEDDWLDVDLGYTYGASYLHILPEYRRTGPVRPVILGETGYEDEPNDIFKLPDARKGDLWNPYRIRRNAWWAVGSGACGYCAGSRLWRWEPDWRATMQVRSIREAHPDPQAAGDDRLAEARPRRGPHLRHGRLRRVEAGRLRHRRPRRRRLLRPRLPPHPPRRNHRHRQARRPGRGLVVRPDRRRASAGDRSPHGERPDRILAPRPQRRRRTGLGPGPAHRIGNHGIRIRRSNHGKHGRHGKI